MSESRNIVLVRARLNAGHSPRTLAKAAEVSDMTVRRAEEGYNIHPANAKAIADVLGVQPTDLFPMPLDAEHSDAA